MSPRSSLFERRALVAFASLAAAFLAGCSATEPAVFPTAEALPEAPRRPDGVAIDPSGALPRTEDRAGTSDGLVTLRTPLGADRAIATVSGFFRGVVREDGDALASVLTRDAVALAPTGSPNAGRTPSAASWWEQRFRRLDYTMLGGETIFREREVAIFRESDGADLPEAPRTLPLAPGDVLLRVPIATPRIGQERLFGDELWMWLRRDGAQYRIYRVIEDFQLP